MSDVTAEMQMLDSALDEMLSLGFLATEDDARRVLMRAVMPVVVALRYRVAELEAKIEIMTPPETGRFLAQSFVRSMKYNAKRRAEEKKDEP